MRSAFARCSGLKRRLSSVGSAWDGVVKMEDEIPEIAERGARWKFEAFFGMVIRGLIIPGTVVGIYHSGLSYVLVMYLCRKDWFRSAVTADAADVART